MMKSRNFCLIANLLTQSPMKTNEGFIFFSSTHGNLEDINDGIWSIVQHYDRFFPDYDFTSKHDLHAEYSTRY